MIGAIPGTRATELWSLFVSVACAADAAAALAALEGILSSFRLWISKVSINLGGVRGMGRTRALLIRLLGSV